MNRTARFLCSLLLRCYPSSYRERCGSELEAAMLMCVGREWRRAGRLGVAYAWLRLALDALSAGASFRIDELRQRTRTRRVQPARAGGAQKTMRRGQQAITHDMVRDFWYATRTLRRAPGFTLVASLTLALGIGAATTVFSVVHSVLIKALSYPDADSLVSIWNTSPASDNAGQVPLSATQLFTYRNENRAFEMIGLWSLRTSSVTGLAEPEEVQTLRVTDGTLQVLGVLPAIGRWFSRNDDSPGAPETIMLTNGYWKRRFGGDPSVVGKTLLVDARPRMVIGVMPAEFRFLNESPDVIVPFQFDPGSLSLGAFNYFGIGRLKRGVTVAQAHTDLARVNTMWLRAWPSPPGSTPERFDRNPVVRPLKEQVVGDVADVLWVLMAMIAAVLLITWANVASLLLVRAEQRGHDVAVRVALGAASSRLARELLLESALLGLLGGVLGVALAIPALRVLVALGPATLPRLAEVGFDRTSFVFALTIAVASSVLLGLILVLRYLGLNSARALRVADRTSSCSRVQQVTRNSLVVAQISLALVLLVGAGLMARTLVALRAVNPGFTDATLIQLGRITIPPTLVDDPERVFEIQRAIVDRIGEMPGVAAASLASAAPMEPFVSVNTLFAEHQRDTDARTRRFKFISPGYFQTVGTPVVAGRDFTWADLDQRRPVAMISENLAREMWGEPRAALGRRIRENQQGPWREIIGVVGDVFDDGVHAPAPPFAYWPALMEHFEGERIRVRRSMTLTIRTNRAGTEGFVNDLERTVWSVNSNLPLSRVRTLQTLYDATLSRTFFTLVMLAIAASTAMLLGIVGIYGVIAYAVVQRTREIGIRIALGAPPRQVRRMFIRYGIVLAALGVIGGSVASIALTRVMSSLLFGISTVDSTTYLTVAVVLMAAAAIASYVPAQRAISVDPVKALRAQ